MSLFAKVTVVLCVWFCILVQNVVCGDDNSSISDREVPTLEQIRTGVLTSRQQIRSIVYKAETRGRALATPIGTEQIFRNTSAITSYHRYVETMHLVPGFDWTDDPNWEQTFLLPGIMEVKFVTQRIVQKSVKESRADRNRKLASSFNDFYLECSGWWPPDEDGSRDNDWPGPPHQSFCSTLLRDDIVVSDNIEIVDGHECVKMTVGAQNEKVWLGVDIGYAVVRRYVSDLENRAHFFYKNGLFQEVLPGVWLPHELSRIIHRGPSPGEIPSDNKLIFSQATRRVREMAINSIGKWVFVPEYKDGTIVVDYDSNTQSAIPGGVDLLDESVQTSRKILAWDPWINRILKYDIRLVNCLLVMLVVTVCVLAAMTTRYRIATFR